ncbi:hypothetical protein ACWFRF_15455 [Nocardia sp. NPDC055165]
MKTKGSSSEAEAIEQDQPTLYFFPLLSRTVKADTYEEALEKLKQEEDGDA